jgi:hypothetical protein
MNRHRRRPRQPHQPLINLSPTGSHAGRMLGTHAARLALLGLLAATAALLLILALNGVRW